MISISAIEEEAVHVLVFLGFSITETENRKIYKKMLPLPRLNPFFRVSVQCCPNPIQVSPSSGFLMPNLESRWKAVNIDTKSKSFKRG